MPPHPLGSFSARKAWTFSRYASASAEYVGSMLVNLPIGSRRQRDLIVLQAQMGEGGGAGERGERAQPGGHDAEAVGEGDLGALVELVLGGVEERLAGGERPGAPPDGPAPGADRRPRHPRPAPQHPRAPRE